MKRTGQKTGQSPLATPAGCSWGDYVEALVAEHGTLAAVAWKLVDRGLSGDVSSVERALRRLRGRGQHDGGAMGKRLLRVFGVPSSIDKRARWMGLYHSPFNDLPVHICADQLRLWDRPPISESKARVWILLGLASVALRRRSFAEAQGLLGKAAAVAEEPAAAIEHALVMAYLVSRLHDDVAQAAKEAEPHLARARRALAKAKLAPKDAACFQARLVDHEAFVANRRGDHERALERYQSLPAADAHPFASYRRDAGNGGDGARATALRSVSAQPPATALRPPPEPGGVAVVKVAAPMSPAPASCAPNGLGNSELEASAPRRSRRSGSPKSRAPRAASAPAGATSRSSRPG